MQVVVNGLISVWSESGLSVGENLKEAVLEGI